MFKDKFQTKETAQAFTAGDCLRRRREEKEISLSEVAESLGIKKEYLENLEDGNYKNLPPQVYVRGFIKSYAQFLGIDGNQLIKIYNREMSFIDARQIQSESRSKKPKKPKWKEYLVITPSILTLAFSVLVFVVMGYYFYRQINSFNSRPYLFLENPVSDEIVKEKDLWVKGKTEEDAILKINGQDISVGAGGNFLQKVTLSEGRNLLIVEAKNRFNKIEKRQLNIIYEKPPEENSMFIEVPAGTETEDNPSVQDAVISDNGDAAATDVKKNNTGGQTLSSTAKKDAVPAVPDKKPAVPANTIPATSEEQAGSDESAVPTGSNLPADDAVGTDSTAENAESGL